MKKHIIILIVASLAIISCKDDTPEATNNNFNRSALQTNLVEKIIIPAYADFDTKLGILETAINDFTTTPNPMNFTTVKTAWLNAYKVWQHIEVFNIGKAEEIKYALQMNVYPTSVTEIENNIMAGNADLSSDANNNAVGFPALDYMLYGLTIDKYTTDINATKYKTYLSDLVDKMAENTVIVINDWNTYKTVFTASASNTATSPFNKFTNDFIYNYEKIVRSNKVGIPAGVFSSPNLLPNRVEAYYNQEVSKTLLLEAYNASVDLFNGKFYTGNEFGESYKTYLIHLGKEALATAINAKFVLAKEKIEMLNINFVTQINSDNNMMLTTYDAIQDPLAKMKVDMLNEFDVTVDYVDGDGD